VKVGFDSQCPEWKGDGRRGFPAPRPEAKKVKTGFDLPIPKSPLGLFEFSDFSLPSPNKIRKVNSRMLLTTERKDDESVHRRHRFF